MKKYMKMTGNVLIYVIAYAMIIYPVIFGLKYIASLNQPFKVWLYANSLFVVIVNDIIAIFLFMPLVRLVKRTKFSEHCKFKALKLTTILPIFLVGIATGFITVCVFRIPMIWERFPDLEGALGILLDSGTFLIFILFLLINSVYKEILFRGLIFNEMVGTIHLYAALVIQAVIYGVVFLQSTYLLMVYAALGGTLFAMLYLWYKSIWASISAQIGSTGGLYIARNVFNISANTFGFYLILFISIAITIVGVYFLWKFKEQLGAKEGSVSQKKPEVLSTVD